MALNTHLFLWWACFFMSHVSNTPTLILLIITFLSPKNFHGKLRLKPNLVFIVFKYSKGFFTLSQIPIFFYPLELFANVLNLFLSLPCVNFASSLLKNQAWLGHPSSIQIIALAQFPNWARLRFPIGFDSSIEPLLTYSNYCLGPISWLGPIPQLGPFPVKFECVRICLALKENRGWYFQEAGGPMKRRHLARNHHMDRISILS